MFKKVIFICTGNSCRSQMAEGWARGFISSSKKGGSAYSAGVSPAGLNPLAVKVMSEVGIDISAQSSDPISSFDLNTFNFCVTVCSDADKHCPILSPQIKKRIGLLRTQPHLMEALTNVIQCSGALETK